MTTLRVWQFGARDLRASAAASRVAMRRTDDQLQIGFLNTDGVLLGAFQATSDGPSGALHRGSPGCAVSVGRGTLHVIRSLARLDCEESKLLNRHVRPLLVGITKATGTPARYFGRDWLDVKSHPIAHVGFTHERATGRTVVEAFVAVRTPFTRGPRGSYLGKAPATLEELVGAIDDAKLTSAIIAAFGAGGDGHGDGDRVGDGVEVGDGHGDGVGDGDGDGVGVGVGVEVWSSRVDEAIGPVCAGRDVTGRIRIGGEWMASFDAVIDLEDRIARGEAIESAVDRAFTAPHTALFGVKSLASFAHVLRDVTVAIRS